MSTDPGALPPLATEDHRCVDCGVSYPDLSIDDAVDAVRQVPGQARAAALAVPPELRRVRPRPDTWSVVEYLCHLRDVYATYTIRLHRTRTETRPVLEPMLNDLRARRFRYNDRDLLAVLDDLEANAEGFREEIARVGDWDRVATRLEHETRTARWLVRQATHEGLHHIRDIVAVGRWLTEASHSPGS